MICFLLDIEPLSNDGVWDRIRALLRNSSVSLNSSVVLTLFTLLLLTLQQTSKMTTLFKRLSNEDTTFLVLCYTTARGRITFVKVAMETKKKTLLSTSMENGLLDSADNNSANLAFIIDDKFHYTQGFSKNPLLIRPYYKRQS